MNVLLTFPGQGTQRTGMLKDLPAHAAVAAGLAEAELRERALNDPAVRAHTDGKTVKSVVVVRGKLVNVVVV